MADEQDKKDNFEIVEAQDGSATVDLPDGMMEAGPDDGQNDEVEAHADDQGGDDGDSGDDRHDDELRQARRNRRRAKKDLIRKTNQEKDLRLQQLQRENEEFKRRLTQLERNTKSADLVRIDKGIEDAQTRLEYAKMKLAEATSNNDGHAMVEAQTLWQSAQEEMRNLSSLRNRADAELKQPAQVDLPDPTVQRLAAKWMKKNSWYNPQANDSDSRIAKKIDELLSARLREHEVGDHGVLAGERAQRMRHDQADEADRAGHRHRGAHRQRRAQHHQRPQPPQVDPEAGGGLGAQGQGIEATPAGQQHQGPGEHERQAEADIVQAAITHRAQQPQHQLVQRVGIGREVQRQRGQGDGPAGDGHPGQDQHGPNHEK